jgi:hypothetical protein
MTFFPITEARGYEIWINPDFIRAVSADSDEPNFTNIYIGDAMFSFKVAEQVGDLLERLQNFKS